MMKIKLPEKLSALKPDFSFLQPVGSFFVVLWKKIRLAEFFRSKAFKAIFLVLVVIIAVAQIVFGVMIYKFKADDKATRFASKIIPFPVAVVNYDTITYSQYLTEKDYIHHFYDATKQENIDITEIDKQIMDQLVENKLIAFEARANKIAVSQKDVDASYADIAAQNGGEEAVTKVLNDLYGINVKKFKELVRTQMLRDKVSDQLIAKVKARHILIRVDANAPDDQVAAAKAKIDALLAQIKGGADFAEVAKKSSEDVGSAEQGGLLEPFAQGDMVDAFSNAAFSTPVGQISDPVRTEFGWHIIKVEEKTGKIQKSFSDWLSELKKNSFIVKFIR